MMKRRMRKEREKGEGRSEKVAKEEERKLKKVMLGVYVGRGEEGEGGREKEDKGRVKKVDREDGEVREVETKER